MPGVIANTPGNVVVRSNNTKVFAEPPTDTVDAGALNESRVAAELADSGPPAGGITRSPALVADPPGVVTVTFPEPMFPGTTMLSVVGVTAATVAHERLIRTFVAPGAVMKPVPLIVTTLPAAAAVGRNDAMVGAPDTTRGVNVCVPVTLELPTLTVTLPADMPPGTVTKSCVDVADTTVAATPLMVTVFALAVVENPEPKTVRALPGAAVGVESPVTANVATGVEFTPVRLPDGS